MILHYFGLQCFICNDILAVISGALLAVKIIIASGKIIANGNPRCDGVPSAQAQRSIRHAEQKVVPSGVAWLPRRRLLGTRALPLSARMSGIDPGFLEQQQTQPQHGLLPRPGWSVEMLDVWERLQDGELSQGAHHPHAHEASMARPTEIPGTTSARHTNNLYHECHSTKRSSL